MTKPPTPDSESPILDAVDFDVVFTVYTDQPIKAFILAQHLDHLKALIESGPQGALLAIVVIDLIIERLYPYTDFRATPYEVYLQAVAGKLRPQDDPRLRDIKDGTR
jgi:hypothetical protein